VGNQFLMFQRNVVTYHQGLKGILLRHVDHWR